MVELVAPARGLPTAHSVSPRWVAGNPGVKQCLGRLIAVVMQIDRVHVSLEGSVQAIVFTSPVLQSPLPYSPH
ncbi:hypothetical protein J6590_071705 [Homalodisca vitripennis]|nr:hypothetical protein J6590_071705 [Homalodisca vitripennis]